MNLRKLFVQLSFLLLVITFSSCKKSSQFDGTDGTKTTHYPNGKIKTSVEFKDGAMNGKYLAYLQDGKLEEEINYKGGVKDGALITYFENGNVKTKSFYIKNKKDSVSTAYFEDGKVKKEERYKDGKLEGKTLSYFSNGTLASELFYKKGEKHGIQKYYYENGKLKALTDFYEGNAGTRLEEYTSEGKRINHDIKIIVKEVDKIAFEDIFIYMFKLNKESSDDRFYTGTLHQGKYFPKSFSFMAKKDGYSIIWDKE